MAPSREADVDVGPVGGIETVSEQAQRSKHEATGTDRTTYRWPRPGK